MHPRISIPYPSQPPIIQVLPAKAVVQVVPPVPVKTEPDISAAVTAWATVALVLATTVLAWLTWVLARATSKASVIATIEPHPAAMNFLDLHIVNEGNATAFDVRIIFDPPLPSSGGQYDDIRHPAAISVFRAGQKLVSNLCEAFVLVENTYSVTISWKPKPTARRRESISYSLDFAHVQGMSTLGKEPLIQTADELKKIREAIERIANGRRVKVDSYSSDDRAEEQAANLARYANQPPAVSDAAPMEDTGTAPRLWSLVRPLAALVRWIRGT